MTATSVSFRATETVEGVHHETSPFRSVMMGTRPAVEYPPPTPLVARACVRNPSAISNPARPVAGNQARLITGLEDQFFPTHRPLTFGSKTSTSYPKFDCRRVCRIRSSCHNRGLCPLGGGTSLRERVRTRGLVPSDKRAFFVRLPSVEWPNRPSRST